MSQNAIRTQSQTQPKQTSLGYQTLSALLWTFSGRSAQLVLRTISIAILARLLTPRDFGVVVAALTVINFSENVALLGIGPAVVQRANLEERHIYTGFTFSLLFSIVLAALIWVSAPLIAAFFQSDGITVILQTVALAFPLTGLTKVAEALMQRELLFRKLVGIDILGYVIGTGITGIGLAVAGFGMWALVGAYIVEEIVRAIAFLLIQPHSKKLWIDIRAFKELFYFGGGSSISKVFTYFAVNGDNLVVGRWLGVSALGLYERAFHIMTVLANTIAGVLERVLFPAMAKVQNESERLMSSYRRGIALISLFILPMSIASYILAPELIIVLLGAKWIELIPTFQILVLGMAFRTSHKICTALATAKGTIYQYVFRLGLYAVFIVMGAWIGQHWGITGVAVGVLIALVIQFFIMAQFALSLIPFTWRQLWSTYVPALRCAGITGVEVWLAATTLRTLNVGSFFILIICFAVVLSTFLILMRLAPNFVLGSDGVWVLDLLLRRMPKRAYFLAWLKKDIKQSPEPPYRLKQRSGLQEHD